MQNQNSRVKQKTLNFEFNIEQDAKKGSVNTPKLRTNNFMKQKTRKSYIMKSCNGLNVINQEMLSANLNQMKETLNNSQQLSLFDIKQVIKRQQLSVQSARSKSQSNQLQNNNQHINKEKYGDMMQVIKEKKKLKGINKIERQKTQGQQLTHRKDQNGQKDKKDNNIFFQRKTREQIKLFESRSKKETSHEEQKISKKNNLKECLQTLDLQDPRDSRFDSQENLNKLENKNFDNLKLTQDSQMNIETTQETSKNNPSGQSKTSKYRITKQVLINENYQQKAHQKEDNKHSYEILIKQFYVSSGNNGSLIAKTLQQRG